MKEDKLECKFALHVPGVSGYREDYHIVKEVVHKSDGTKQRRLKFIKDFKRPYYITKPIYQNHKEKKEVEDLDKVHEFFSTQTDLARNISVKLGRRTPASTMRDVTDSQYLYGVDVSSTAVLKKVYRDRFPDAVSTSTVATLDIENDIDTKKITVITVSTKEAIHTVVSKEFVAGISNVESKVKALYDKEIPDSNIKDSIKDRTFEVLDNELEMIKSVFAKLHRWKPDFLAIHNMDYDIPMIINVLEKYYVDPKDIFSDPIVPKELRMFKYKKGIDRKQSADGESISLGPQQQWHTVVNTASFYIIDSMSVYNYVRTGQAVVPGGYGLDNLLRVNKITGKIFKELNSAIKGAEWHRFMSKEHPLEYIVYNQYDTISMHVLEDKTKDLTVATPILAEYSDFTVFNSGPKRLIVGLHFYYLDNGAVIGSRAPKVLEEKLLGLDEWIVTLPSYRVLDNGMLIANDDGVRRTNIRIHVCDTDAVSSYPSNIIAGNVSKQTTYKEIIAIAGMSKEEFKQPNMSLFVGESDSIDYCNTMFNMPTMEDLLDDIKKKDDSGVVSPTPLVSA